MKKTVSGFLFVVLSVYLWNCGQPKTETSATTEASSAVEEQVATAASESENGPWYQSKEEFHTLMALTFHPAEEGDFEPVKKNHLDLVQKAKDWSALEIPVALAEKEMDVKLQNLIKGAESVSELVTANAETEKIKTSLFALHDVFHGIEGACKNEEAHGMDHHHGNGHESHH